MFKFLKKLFSNKDSYKYSDEEYNSYFANILQNLVTTGDIKEYKGIKEFIKKYKTSIEQIPLKRIEVTEEIAKFIKQAKLLQYKSTNKAFIKYINKVLD